VEPVWSFCRTTLAEDTGGVRRRRLTDALCRAFSGTRPQAVGEVMVPLLEAGDPHLRARAANCLRQPVMAGFADALQHYRERTETWELRAAGFDEELVDDGDR